MSYGLLENALNTVGQVGASLGAGPSSQFRNARPAQTERTADDDLEFLLAKKVNSINPFLGKQGGEQGSTAMVVAAEELLVAREPAVDDVCVAPHPGAGDSVVLKALQQVADVGKGKRHGLRSA